MFEKHKHHSLDIVIVAVILASLAFGWALSRSYALVQHVDMSLPANTRPINRVSPEATATAPAADALQFEQMLAFHEQMEKTVNDFVAAEPNDYGIVVKHLPTGDTVASGADTQFIAASLYKPIAAVEVLRLVDGNQLSLETVLPETDGRTVEQCIWDAITVSDNPCGRALRIQSNLGTPGGMQRLRQMGLGNTDLRGDYPVTTAHDMAVFFEKLHDGSYLSDESNRLLTNALNAQLINNRLPQGLPEGTKVAHKTGDLEGTVHDAGIVYGPTGDYIIIIMSGPDASGHDLDSRYAKIAEFTGHVHAVMLQVPDLDAAS